MLVTVAATLLAVPQLALADQVEDQLQQMQQRMTELENKLQATNDELATSKEKVDQQEELIKKAGIDEARGAESGVPALEWLKLIEMDGFVASSWNYNFNVLSSKDITQDSVFGDGSPTTVFGENGGRIGLVAPGHTNSNSFQLDQLWIGIGKPATMESNAGFRADIVFGALADSNREGAGYTTENGFTADDTGTGDLPHVFQAYAEYLAPVGENGISFKGGRFATLIGAESFRQDSNFNITRGINWALQPVNHTGLMVSGKCSKCSMDWAIGAVNGYSDTMSDRDNAKGVLGGLKWSGEKTTFATNVYWGGDVGDFTPTALYGTDFGIAHNSDSVGVLDAILTWNPSDRLSTWANFDFYWIHDNDGSNNIPNNANIYTGSIASRYAVTDSTGVALRGEYQWWASDFGAVEGPQHLWSLTGTIDHSLTENLIVKLEARYDHQDGHSDGNQFFLSGGHGNDVWNNKGQTLGLVQMLYKF